MVYCMLNVVVSISVLYRVYKHVYVNKGKTTPVQAWTGPEGSSRLRFPYFKTVGV